MRTVTVSEAETGFSELLAAVESGEEIVIVRAGRPIARLLPVGVLPPRPIGLDDGKIHIADDFDPFIPSEFRT